ncbi:hypothetical protein AX289_31255 [Methylorubrum populi]|nr:hypothetical protein AX289_31255 [Methylorubrum populi]
MPGKARREFARNGSLARPPIDEDETIGRSAGEDMVEGDRVDASVAHDRDAEVSHVGSEFDERASQEDTEGDARAHEADQRHGLLRSLEQGECKRGRVSAEASRTGIES